MPHSPAERHDRPLAVLTPPGKPEQEPAFPVFQSTARIGQGPQNDVVLDDDTVSTRHAVLEYAAGGWRITDLESRNGTYVDGVRLAAKVPTPVSPPVTLRFGAMELLFASGDAEAIQEPVAAAAPSAAVEVERRSTGFRLPVWLLLLILLFVAALIFLYLAFGGTAAAMDPGLIEAGAMAGAATPFAA